jgi:hypothetical protein
MKTLHLARTGLLAVALAASAGCVKENTASVEPFALCSMPDDCTFGATCGSNYLGTPTLDVAGLAPLILAIEMHNQLPNNADTSTGQANTHDAHLESYTASYGLAGVTDSTGTAQQVIPAEGTSVVAIALFDEDLTGTITSAASGVVTVTLKGRYDDGSKWESPYKIPFVLCNGCSPFVGCSDATQTLKSACPTLFQLPVGKPTCG